MLVCGSVSALRFTGSLLCCKPYSLLFQTYQTILIMDERLLKILNNNEQNYPHALEKQFPRVFNKIMGLWDSSGFDAYLTDLMTTKRTGRQGFPQEVASDIIYLSMLHELKGDTSQTNTWAEVLRDDKK